MFKKVFLGSGKVHAKSATEIGHVKELSFQHTIGIFKAHLHVQLQRPILHEPSPILRADFFASLNMH
jgi:hypothetical protein